MHTCMLAAVLLPLAMALPAAAQQSLDTAVPFQRIAPDARSAGMGEVGAATAPDVYAMHWNAAKYMFAEGQWGIGFNYTPWLRRLADGMGLSLAAGYRKLGDLQAVAFSMKFFALGDFQFADQLGNETMRYRPNEFSIDAAYVRKLSPNLSASVAFRYLRSAVGAYSYVEGTRAQGAGFAADMGVFFKKGIAWGAEGGTFAMGMNVSNLGPPINYVTELRPLPTTLRLGASVSKRIDVRNAWAWSVDVEQPLRLWRGRSAGGEGGLHDDGNRDKMRVSSGVELSLLDAFALRTGVSYTPAKRVNQRFVTAGFGLLFNGWGVDMAYLIPYEPHSPIAHTLRVGVSLQFTPPFATTVSLPYL